jgi:hypothetical protein
LIDNGSSDGTAEVVERLAREHPEVHPLWIDHWVGEGAGRNVGLLRSQGHVVVVLGNHIEVAGDIFTPVEQALRDPEIGLVGGWGVQSSDLRNFESSAGGGGCSGGVFVGLSARGDRGGVVRREVSLLSPHRSGVRLRFSIVA